MAILRVVKDGGTLSGYDKAKNITYSLGFRIATNAGILKMRSTGGQLITSQNDKLKGETKSDGTTFGFAVSPRNFILTAGSSENQGD